MYLHYVPLLKDWSLKRDFTVKSFLIHFVQADLVIYFLLTFIDIYDNS